MCPKETAFPDQFDDLKPKRQSSTNPKISAVASINLPISNKLKVHFSLRTTIGPTYYESNGRLVSWPDETLSVANIFSIRFYLEESNHK